MLRQDVVGALQAVEPKLPQIYRPAVKDAIEEIVSLRARLEAALAAAREPMYHHLPDYPER